MAEEKQEQKQEEDEEEELELPDLTKVVGSLEELVRQGELSRERASFARQKIEDLHTAISKSKAVRRKLTNDSLDLSLRLETEIESLKKAMQLQAEDETTLDLLTEDGETADNEALLCREKEQALLLEEADLRKAQEDFQKRLKEIEEEHAAALAPQMLQLKLDTEALKRQIQEGTSKMEQCRKEQRKSKTVYSNKLTMERRCLRRWVPVKQYGGEDYDSGVCEYASRGFAREQPCFEVQGFESKFEKSRI